MSPPRHHSDSPEIRDHILKRSFAFLEREFQYRIAQATGNLLRWDGGHTFFAVGHGPLGARFGLRFGPLRAPGQAAAIFEAVDLTALLPAGQPLPWSSRPYRSVQEFAEIAYTCGRFFYAQAPGILRGEQPIFARLARARAERERQAARSRTASLVEQAAEQACVTTSKQASHLIEAEAWALGDPEAEAILAEAEQNARRRLEIFVRSAKREIWERHARGLRPQARDFPKAFTPQAAPRAAGIYLSLWEGELPLPAPWTGQTVLTLTACFAEWFSYDCPRARAFPPGYRDIAHLLAPGSIWLAWKYTRPGGGRGSAYDGLVRVGDRWVWLLRPHRVLAALVC